MTKKVNSITFRLGYNLFWYYKRSNFFFFFKFRDVFRICKKKLRLTNFIALAFNYLFNSFFIYVYFIKKIKKLRQKFIIKENLSKKFLIIKQFLNEKKTFKKKNFKNNLIKQIYFTNLIITKLSLNNNTVKKTNTYIFKYITKYIYLQRFNLLLKIYSKILLLSKKLFICYFYYLNLYYLFFNYNNFIIFKFKSFIFNLNRKKINFKILLDNWLQKIRMSYQLVSDNNINSLNKSILRFKSIFIKLLLLKNVKLTILNKKQISFIKVKLRGFKKIWLNKFSVHKLKVNFNSKIVISFFFLRYFTKFKLIKFLFFKKKELILETSLFNIYKYKLNIFLYNILNDLNVNIFFSHFNSNLYTRKKYNFLEKNDKRYSLYKIASHFKRSKKVNLKRYRLIIFLIFFFKNTELIAKYFGNKLLKDKKHIRNIKIFLKLFYKLYVEQLIDIKGFKVYISGKLNGKMRKKKYSYKIGKMWLNTLDSNISHYYFPLFTKFGIFSIKIWLSF